jgi:hypothetical protein
MMKKITHIFFLTIALAHNYTAIAMEQPTTHLLVIPGQNGMGGQNVDTVLPYFAQHRLKHEIETPQQNPDFGQTNCLTLLKKKIDDLKDKGILQENDHLVIHGSSQGTATTINYAAKNPQNIKAIILESVMLTGNSAIFHTVDKMMLADSCNLPDSSYYALPYTAKSLFPNYSPTGKQPIFTADKLPQDLPIIILHDTQDFQLSFKDAQALYAFLTHTKKNKYVYLFAQESPQGAHINLLKHRNKKEIAAINTILALHNILPFEQQEITDIMIDLKEYQPEPQQEWLDHFANILNK